MHDRISDGLSWGLWRAFRGSLGGWNALLPAWQVCGENSGSDKSIEGVTETKAGDKTKNQLIPP